MLTFNEVVYQNFLGTGNAPIRLRLDRYASTLIVGINGGGKSTFCDAICFALFGRPYRNVNKPKLVNTINGRDCLVELKFTTNGGIYSVRRGIKPALFEIYENGNLIPPPSDIKDYQATLEDHILKLNFKAFCQVVVLGNASYTPFMRLAQAGRRSIIEDLLDIEVFSLMNNLSSDDLKRLKSDLETLETKMTLTAEQVRMAQSFVKQISEQNKALIETINTAMVAQATEIDVTLKERASLIDALKAYEKTKQDLSEAKAKLRTFETTLSQLQSKAKTLVKERAFYVDHDTCPECEQVITEAFKSTKFSGLTEKEGSISEAVAKCQTFIGRWSEASQAAESTLGEAQRLTSKIQKIDAQLPVHRRRLIELEQQFKNAQKPPVEQPHVDVTKLSSQLDGMQDENAALSKRKVMLDAASMLLKDNGIKTRVIKHYLPIINKQVNHYLQVLDFPILFYFNEEFEEVIKSRNREEFVYELFSEGEKKRIDIALLLAWRAVARLKNSAATNLLILDEVMDGSLDASGIESVLKVLQSLENGNVFVISHRDQAIDKFSHVLTFAKRKGFSEIVQ